jgi:hypothetical protein
MCKRPKSSQMLSFINTLLHICAELLLRIYLRIISKGNGKKKQNQSHKNLVKNYHYAIKRSFSLVQSLSALLQNE